MKDPKMKEDEKNSMYPYFPHEARIRNMTYQINSKVDVHIEKRMRDSKDQPGKLLDQFKTE
jgi:DNA-directed RNA polymerase beta subunit